MPTQRSSASWDAGGAAEEEERGAEKPEPESGSQAGGNGSSPGEGGEPLAPHESPVQRPAVKSPRRYEFVFCVFFLICGCEGRLLHISFYRFFCCILISTECVTFSLKNNSSPQVSLI